MLRSQMSDLTKQADSDWCLLQSDFCAPTFLGRPAMLCDLCSTYSHVMYDEVDGVSHLHS